MNKFLAVTFVWILSIVLGVFVMICGWGVEPKSWWWIIGGGIGARFVVEVVGILAKKDGN